MHPIRVVALLGSLIAGSHVLACGKTDDDSPSQAQGGAAATGGASGGTAGGGSSSGGASSGGTALTGGASAGGSGGTSDPTCLSVQTDLPVEYSGDGGSSGQAGESPGTIEYEPEDTPLPAWAAEEGLAPLASMPGGVCCPPGEYFIELTRDGEETLFVTPFGSPSASVPWLYILDGERSVSGCEASPSSACMSVTREEVRVLDETGLYSFPLTGLRIWLQGHSSVYVGEFWADAADGTGEPLSGRFRVCFAGTGYT